jgi:hypothetical protein
MTSKLDPPALVLEEANAPLPLSAANFARTPLGRVVLHLECLCHHPAAARFHFNGLTRNLGEWAQAAKQSLAKSLKNLRLKNRRGARAICKI